MGESLQGLPHGNWQANMLPPDFSSSAVSPFDSRILDGHHLLIVIVGQSSLFRTQLGKIEL